MTRRTRGGVLLAGLATLFASLLVGLAPAQAIAPPIEDGGFESASGNPLLSASWVETDNVFGTPICDAICGDGQGTAGPRTGSKWAWFGGHAGDTHKQSLTQDFTLNPSVATFSFWLRIGQSQKPLTSVLKVEVDGKLIKKFTEPQRVRAYKLYEFDFTKYADGNPHTLKFSYTNGGKSQTLDNWSLDDVSLDWVAHTDSDGDTVVNYYDKCDDASGPSPSGCPTLGHDVTLSYSSGKFKGNVTDAECGDTATVKIMKVRSGADAVVATVKTNAGGAFAVSRPAPAGTYYAVSPKRLIPVSGICPGATSALLQR